MRRILLLISMLFGALLIAWVLNSKEQDELEIISNTMPEKYERQFIDVDLKISREADIGSRDSIYQSGILKKSNGKFFIASTADNKIHILDEELKKIREIGKGQGRGPGEIEYLVDLSIQKDQIWATDMRQLALHMFKNNGDYIKSIYVKGHPLRITSIGKDPVVMTMGNGTDSLFTFISADNEKKQMFGRIVKSQVKNFLALTGELEKYDNWIVYIPKHASLIYIYDEDRDLRDIIQAPDGQYFPGVKSSSTGDGVQYSAPESLFEVIGTDIDDGKLFVMVYKRANQNSDDSWHTYLDVYDLANKTYLYSYKTDLFFQDFVFNEELKELCGLKFDGYLSCYHVVEN